MAQIIWSEPALADLEAIADRLALDTPAAAREFVRTALERVAAVPPVRTKVRGYRAISNSTCRVIYRMQDETMFILHVTAPSTSRLPGLLHVQEDRASAAPTTATTLRS